MSSSHHFFSFDKLCLQFVMTMLNLTAVLLEITLRTLFKLWKLVWRMSVLLARRLLRPALPPIPRKEEPNPRRSLMLDHHLTTLMMAGPASAAHISTHLQWTCAVSAKKVGTSRENSSKGRHPMKSLNLMRKRGAFHPALDAENPSFQQLYWCTESWNGLGCKWSGG